MKRFTVLLLLTFVLIGCTKTTVTDSLVDTANQTIDTMYNAIPVECRNDTVTNLRATSKEQIKAINNACQLQKDALQAEISKKNTIIFSLCLLILVCVGANAFLKFRL